MNNKANGIAFKALMKAHGFTAADMAYESGLALSTIENCMIGKGTPRWSTRAKLAKLLGPEIHKIWVQGEKKVKPMPDENKEQIAKLEKSLDTAKRAFENQLELNAGWAEVHKELQAFVGEISKALGVNKQNIIEEIFLRKGYVLAYKEIAENQ